MTDEADGDCFEVAGDFMIHLPEDKQGRTKLCHAEIIGHGPIEGVLHWHAWIEQYEELTHPELGTFRVTCAIDKSNGKNITLPAGMYRNLARAETVYEYDFNQSCANMVREQHYGPWEVK